ncbi:MAG: radical SAM protein [Opitutae bacterium]|jgi:radical SAM protein with 4Fe4S-binding SPASM domain|nr:radical SAM protein [Opitutae bacterium]MBT5910951.1 radical SAM protein [Opitutae bacterium]MBT7743008.1 radical SAM protein [Opitutae bacterium]
MTKDIREMKSIYSLKTLRNIFDAKVFQIFHFLKFISIWRKYKRSYDFPILFQIQTVNRCNADCKMCPYSSTTAQNSLMLMEDKLFNQLINEISGRNEVDLIVLSLQNEPLVDKKIVDRAKYIKINAPKVKLELVSNGYLLKPSIVDEIYGVFDIVTLSIHATTSKTYMKVMGGLDFHVTLNNLIHIRQSRSMRSKTTLRFVKQKQNHMELKTFKKYWNREGFAVLSFDLNSRLNSVKEMHSLRYRVTFYQKLMIGFLKKISPFIFPSCPIPNISMYIRSNGDVVYCFNDWTEGNIVGNLNSTTIHKLFNSIKMKKFRKRISQNKACKNDICTNCDLYKDGVYLTF